MNHYLITTHDGRVFLAPNFTNHMEALAQYHMPAVCDIAAIDEWQGDCTWLNIYSAQENHK